MYLWSIFSSRILSAVYEKRLIVNIDESSYNRSVKSNYSWLPIGCSSPILNTNCTGRTTIILGLFSNGHWLWMSVNGTTKAKHFWIFLQLLHKFIENCWEEQVDTIKVVFDNARIHLTDGVKKLWTYLKLEINTLPAYTPQLAPVETVFGISKRQILKQSSGKPINFGKPSGKRAVMDSLKSLSVEIWIKIWARFIRIAKRWIVEAYGVSKIEEILISGHEDKKDGEQIGRPSLSIH